MLIKKTDFDLTNPTVVVRLMCGLFYIPHILFKLNDMDGAVGFFGKVGLEPAYLFVVLAILAEGACALGLTFNILTKWIGIVSAFVMGMAVYAIFAVKGAGWLWNMGGVEYLIFWAVTSIALSVQAWKQEAATYGKVSLLFPARQM
ncbi:MAG: DoxX family protein [Magnetospiraceae bacterium]